MGIEKIELSFKVIQHEKKDGANLLDLAKFTPGFLSIIKRKLNPSILVWLVIIEEKSSKVESLLKEELFEKLKSASTFKEANKRIVP